MVRLNLDDLKEFDDLVVAGYREWVEEAPDQWKVDGFLENRSPIVVTSRFGQNARIAVPRNETEEAKEWESERDYSKMAFVTFALATLIKYVLSLVVIVS